MIRKLIFIFVFCWFYNSYSQQNLVLNPSFEEISNCPNQLSQINNINSWDGVMGTPDYYNTCGTGLVNLPNTIYGYQNSNSGNGIIGIICWGFYTENNREFIKGYFSSELIENYRYLIDFFVSSADSSLYEINSIGAFISTFSYNSFDFTNIFPTVSPQIFADYFFGEKQKWIKINGSFIANGGEKFIYLGNFHPDASTDTMFISNGNLNSELVWRTAYYYIDNVSVVKDTSYHPIGIEEEQLERIKLAYQDGNLLLQGLLFQNRETELFLYCYDGKQVGSYTLPKGSNSIPLKLPVGIYLYSLKSGEQILKRGKIWVGGE